MIQISLRFDVRGRILGPMPGFFYSLGKYVGPKVRKGRWVWDSLTASPEEILQSEFETGRDMAAAMLEQMPADRDGAESRLVDEIGGRLVGRLTDRRRRWAFHLVGTPAMRQGDAAGESHAGSSAEGEPPNAFALPGGFIFITRSLVHLCERTADEIAFILGHEIGHVIRGHALDRLVSSALLGVASKATPVGRVLSPAMIGAGVRLMQSAYTQDQETEADSFGVRLAHSAGYDPAASVRMMQRLQALAGKDLTPEFLAYFSTHPPFPERIVRLRTALGQ